MLKMKMQSDIEVPSIKQIQEILVRIGDKEMSFAGSRDWIGAAETCYVIDEIFNVPCHLHHITNNENISSKKTEIVNYFQDQGGLIAMGGDEDASSKLIAGVHISSNDELSLLVVVSSQVDGKYLNVTFIISIRILISMEFQRMTASSFNEATSNGRRKTSSWTIRFTTCACQKFRHKEALNLLTMS